MCQRHFKFESIRDPHICVKIAKVIPMYKSGTKTDVTNYRPISILPQFLKILEKLFLTIINSFFYVSTTF